MAEDIGTPSADGGGAAEKTTISAALLDANGVYKGMVELQSKADLTSSHVSAGEFGGGCDLPPDLYRWMKPVLNADGSVKERGRFEPLPPKTAEQKFVDAEPLPAIAADMIHRWTLDNAALTAKTLAWLDGYALSFDFKSTLKVSPEAQQYVAARGLAQQQ